MPRSRASIWRPCDTWVWTRRSRHAVPSAAMSTRRPSATELQKPTPRRRITVGCDLLAHIQIIDPALARGDWTWVLMAGKCLANHCRSCFHEAAECRTGNRPGRRSCREAGRTWRRRFAGHFRWIATRIVTLKSSAMCFSSCSATIEGPVTLDQAPFTSRSGWCPNGA